MPAIVLTILKVTFLLLLYFFVYRAVRTIAADLYGRRAAPEPQRREARAARAPKRSRGGVPTKLVVMSQDGAKLATHRLAGTLRIGRDRACEIAIDDTYASQEHARVTERNGTWMVEDLGSTNGTYLNRQKVTVPTAISPGDRIRVGNTFLEARR